jgi:hypothetical protein
MGLGNLGYRVQHVKLPGPGNGPSNLSDRYLKVKSSARIDLHEAEGGRLSATIGQSITNS